MDAGRPLDTSYTPCTATSKQSGVRCKRRPIPGGTVCVMHGGKAPHVQAAALDMKIVEFPVPLIYLEEERSFGGALDQAARRLAYYHEVIDREVASLHLPNHPQAEGNDCKGDAADCRPATCGSSNP